MKFALRSLFAMIAAFMIKATIPAVVYQLVGQRMLQSAGWVPGVLPPTGYVILAVTTAFVALALAGIVAAIIVGQFRIQHACVCGALFTFLIVWSNRSTLFTAPHPDEWPLALAPLLFMPLGAWLVSYLKSRAGHPPLKRAS